VIVLVDTSVRVDFLRGRRNPKADLFDIILARDIPFGISAFTYQEILPGVRDKREF
jgi:predicted nucleic acid-binding protein